MKKRRCLVQPVLRSKEKRGSFDKTRRRSKKKVRFVEAVVGWRKKERRLLSDLSFCPE
jgi:hypothetical protein